MATDDKNDKGQAKEQKAGSDQSRTAQTSSEAEKAQEERPTTPQERKQTDSDAAASGSSTGAVVDGDVLGKTDHDKDNDGKDDRFEKTHGSLTGDKPEVEGAIGTVPERNADGDEFEVPWVYLTAEHVARTSDHDDAARAWTAQDATGERKDADDKELPPVALVEVQGTPGQTFRVRELPNRAVAEAAGIDWELWVAGLPVRPDVPGEAPRRGIPA